MFCIVPYSGLVPVRKLLSKVEGEKGECWAGEGRGQFQGEWQRGRVLCVSSCVKALTWSRSACATLCSFPAGPSSWLATYSLALFLGSAATSWAALTAKPEQRQQDRNCHYSAVISQVKFSFPGGRGSLCQQAGQCGWLRFCLCLLLSPNDIPSVPFVTALSFLLCRSLATPYPPALLTLPWAHLPQGCHLYPRSCWPPTTTRALWALTRAMTPTRAPSAPTRAPAPARAPPLTLARGWTAAPSPPGTQAQCQAVPPECCPCTTGRVTAPASSGSAWTGSMPASTRASWWVAQLWAGTCVCGGVTEPIPVLWEHPFTELAHQTWLERENGTWCHAECVQPGRNEMFENSLREVSGLEIGVYQKAPGEALWAHLCFYIWWYIFPGAAFPRSWGFWKQGADMPFNSAASPVKKGESPSFSRPAAPEFRHFPLCLFQTYPSSATGAGPGVMWLSSAGDPQGLLGANKCGVVLSTFSSCF